MIKWTSKLFSKKKIH